MSKKYEIVIQLSEYQDDCVFKLLENEEFEEAIEYLKQWHYPDEHEITTDISKGKYDKKYINDEGYILIYNLLEENNLILYYEIPDENSLSGIKSNYKFDEYKKYEDINYYEIKIDELIDFKIDGIYISNKQFKIFDKYKKNFTYLYELSESLINNLNKISNEYNKNNYSNLSLNDKQKEKILNEFSFKNWSEYINYLEKLKSNWDNLNDELKEVNKIKNDLIKYSNKIKAHNLLLSGENKYWSKQVTEKIKKSEKPKALTFTKDYKYIINELLNKSEGNINTAIKKLQFYINRAGKKLKNKINIYKAKQELQKMNKAKLRQVAGDILSYSIEKHGNNVEIINEITEICYKIEYKDFIEFDYIIVNFNNNNIYFENEMKKSIDIFKKEINEYNEDVIMINSKELTIYY